MKRERLSQTGTVDKTYWEKPTVYRWDGFYIAEATEWFQTEESEKAHRYLTVNHLIPAYEKGRRVYTYTLHAGVRVTVYRHRQPHRVEAFETSREFQSGARKPCRTTRRRGQFSGADEGGRRTTPGGPGGPHDPACENESPRGAAGSYEVTDLGLKTIPVLEALANIGVALDPSTAAHPLPASRISNRQGEIS